MLSAQIGENCLRAFRSPVTGNCRPTPYLALVIIALILLALRPAQALMAAPEDKYADITRAELESLRSLGGVFAAADRLAMRFEIMRGSLWDKPFFVVRIEGGGCKDYCPTAFFNEALTPRGLAGIGLFPRLLTTGELPVDLGEPFGRAVVLIFVGQDDQSKTVLVSERGILF